MFIAFLHFDTLIFIRVYIRPRYIYILIVYLNSAFWLIRAKNLNAAVISACLCFLYEKTSYLQIRTD